MPPAQVALSMPSVYPRVPSSVVSRESESGNRSCSAANYRRIIKREQGMPAVALSPGAEPTRRRSVTVWRLTAHLKVGRLHI